MAVKVYGFFNVWRIAGLPACMGGRKLRKSQRSIKDHFEKCEFGIDVVDACVMGLMDDEADGR